MCPGHSGMVNRRSAGRTAQISAGASDFLTPVMTRATACLQAADYAGALGHLLSARQHLRRNEIASNTVGYLYLKGGDSEQALGWFDIALKIRADYAEAWAGRGLALQNLARLQEAAAAYTRALQIQPADAVTWYNVAVVLDALGALEEALDALETAIAQDPRYRAALTLRCVLLDRLGRYEAFREAAEALCKQEPHGGEGPRMLGDALQKLGHFTSAVVAYDLAVSIDTSSPVAWANRARVLAELGREDEARASILRALALDPDEPESLTLLGNLEKRAGRLSEAETAYRQAVALRPIKICHKPRIQPLFRALFVMSPIVGNTPFDDLVRDADFESRSIMLVDGVDYDMARIARDIDVVVNLISDADCGLDVLKNAEAFVARLARPLVNRPRLVAGTDRQSIARRLADVPGLCMPQTRRVTRAELHARGLDGVPGFTYPVILRLSGTHGGERMELVASHAAVLDFLAATEGEEFYLTRYHDYQSPDGLFRKYRFIFVDDEILPYHLAIGDGWKVHHAATRMADTPWMQEEERAFLEAPHEVFDDAAFAILRKIQREIGLDYFGIDCALDRAGQVVAFEINPTMLVHLNNARFPYKNAHVLRIKQAFARLLARRADVGGADRPVATT